MQATHRPSAPSRSAATLGFAVSATAASAASFSFTPTSPIIVDNDPVSALPSSASFNFTDAGGASLATNIEFNVASTGKPAASHSGSYGDGGDPETTYHQYTFAVEGNTTGGAKPSVQLLGTGTTVNAGLVGPAVTTGSLPAAEFTNGWDAGATVQGFLGFSYQESISSTALYGWAEFAYDQPSDSLALLSFGYDDSGAAAITPESLTPYTAVPEPASIALGAALCAGSAALLKRRRRTVALAA